MEKKIYVKPQATKVELRIEERMASCSYYDSRYTQPGCTDYQFQNDPNVTCYNISEFVGS